MKRIAILAMVAASLANSALPSRAQTPGSILGLSAQVNGSLSVESSKPSGCTTRTCTTNIITKTHCFTNAFWKRVCTTNAAGVIQCTNVSQPVVRCYTNTVPEITCTNEILTPVSLAVSARFSGAFAETHPCNEIEFPSNAVFQAALRFNLRTNDWVGTQEGTFRVLDGTNVLASGSMTGISGLRSHRPGDPCGMCNHFEGNLRGLISSAGPLHRALLQATYAADITDATCPSPSVPQGATVLVIDGIVVTPCPAKIESFAGFRDR
jgi:hypothetical protein